MASRQEVAAVYAAAVVQGVALVAFPAVSAILTDPAEYHLTKTEYGGMFVPQAITAVLSSLLGAGLTRRTGAKRVLLVGLLADLAAMGLLFASKFFVARHPVAFGLLLAATGCLGCGFGFVVPTLNTFTAAFFPQRTDGAILTLNALLGVGTALAPIFALCFVGLGCWWGLPLLVGGSTLALWLFAQRLPLSSDVPRTADGSANTAHRKIEARFWIYAAFALVYGICETMNGNWASVYLSTNVAASTTIASLALTLFWVCVTGGRVLFAVVGRWLPPAWTYRALPLLLAGAFAGTAMVSRGQSVLGLLGFGVAGLGCSALLPLVVSFAQEELTAMGSAVAGGLIGFYQIGYGIGAFGVGPVENWAHLSLRAIFGWTAVLAIGLECIALVIISGRPTRKDQGTSP